MTERKNILVIGAGAVGGITAAVLKKHNYNVNLVSKYQEITDISNTKGLHIFGHCGDHRVKVPAVARVVDIKIQPDYVFIATKALDMPQAAKDILPFLHEDARVISMQNGIVEEELASIVGTERTVGSSVGWGATMHENGKLEMTSGGEFVIGYLDRPEDEKLKHIQEMLSHIVPVTISDHILSDLYSKLIINSCVSSLGAICGQTLGKMLGQRKVRIIFLRIIREAIDVAKAMKLVVKPYAGRLNYYALLKQSSVRQHLFLMAFGFKYRKLRSSSLQSLLRGRKTEVLYFNGFIVDKGKEFEVSTPVNVSITKMIQEIEDKKREITPVNFEGVLR